MAIEVAVQHVAQRRAGDVLDGTVLVPPERPCELDRGHAVPPRSLHVFRTGRLADSGLPVKRRAYDAARVRPTAAPARVRLADAPRPARVGPTGAAGPGRVGATALARIGSATAGTAAVERRRRRGPTPSPRRARGGVDH